MKRRAIMFVIPLLAACHEAQDPQIRYGTLAAAQAPWPASGAALPLPEGVVAQGDLELAAQAREPPEATAALLARGRERFGIFCSPCHGVDGYGEGIIVARGFPHPPSFHEARLRAAPAQLFFDTITNGNGAMYSYADRVPPTDRWAIIAYIRALQLSQRGAERR
jgi:mono/diheme cytochrome c family protein